MKRIPVALIIALGAGVAINAATSAFAQEENAYPEIEAEVIIDMLSEQGIRSDDMDGEHNNTVLEAEAGVEVLLTEHFSIEGVVLLEPVKDPDAGESNVFEDEGVLVEELAVKYENGPWEAYGGKINPGFNVSLADKVRGIWAEDFSDEYEINEKIGVGGSYTYESGRFGTHSLGASTFFADTTFLSGSLGTSRGRTSRSDGGVSNTQDFSSYLVLLEGQLPETEYEFFRNKPYYKLGYRRLAAGDADGGSDDEQGRIVTLGDNLVADVTSRLEADIMFEFTYIRDFENSGNDNRYYTVGLVNTFDKKWSLAAAYTARNISVPGDSDINDHLLQLTGGYAFGNGVLLEAGWRSTEEDGIDNDIIGMRLRYSFTSAN